MYLSRIEMSGFKSFANKTSIEFDQGMTAIVGPNGSGKSNLSEAIRWVLGEQSAKSLRGSRMEDVIFNGSQAKKAVNYASVTLVLNNEDRYLDYDQNEVAICRQYHRNGDSLYFINKQPVRLKDITDLLLDTGIGRNSFAMISQGKVESIFLSKPEERRGIFEEAAGVQRYQVRKAEAERKLVRSRDHLSRLRDILHELNSQLEPLKLQYDTALIYQEKSQLLKNQELSLYTFEIGKNKEAWEQGQKELNICHEQLQSLVDQKQKTDQILMSNQNQLDRLIETIDEKSLTIQDQAKLLEQRKGKLQILQQDLRYAKLNQDDQSEQKEALSNQLTDSQQASVVQKEKVDQLTLDIQSLELQLTDLKSQIQAIKETESKNEEDIQSDLFDYYRQESHYKNQVNQFDQIQQRFLQKKHNIEEAQEQVLNLFKEWDDVSNQLDAKMKMVQQDHILIKKDLSKCDLVLQELSQDLNNKEQFFYKLQESYQMSNAKYQSLLQMQEDYAGYHQGVRFVMQHREQLQGIEGTVADAIQVEPIYQEAIDTALGASLQNIIVTDDYAARSAIQLLRKNQAGRATFLPRNNIKGRKIADYQLNKAQQNEGFIGLASDLVSSSRENREIVEQLLGTCIVVNDLESAQSLAKAVNQQAKIVSLKGDLILPGGAVTGGKNHHKRSSVLSRQSQLAQLEEALKQDRLQLKDVKELITNYRQKQQENMHRREQSEKKIQDLLSELESLRSQQEQITNQKEQKDLQLAIKKDDFEMAKTEFEREKEQYKANLQTLDQLKAKIDAGNQALKNWQTDQGQKQEKLDSLLNQSNTVKTELAVKNMQLVQENKQLEGLKHSIEKLANQLEENQESNRSSQEQINQLHQKIQTLSQLIQREEQTLVQAKDAIENLKVQRKSLNGELQSDRENEKDLEARLQKLYQEEAHLQASIDQYDRSMDQQLTYLSEAYQISFEAAKAQSKPIDNVRQTKDLVKRLRREIEQLGPVNLQALQDYQGLQDRYDSMKVQETDLLKAMDQLQATMDEMDQEVESRFKIAFEAINHQFKQTFVALFGGGRAYLVLTDPKDLLVTGIDIVAQPPGKKKQNLALLSGGERALTAIALLFAILQTKTVPFVVLDEVEAALDDANVYRYGQYIQNFAHRTQFIVITHRKGTMEYADSLYGVTMQETGISKLASVKLAQFNA
ncbi:MULTISPECIES: chromosome segregation protein SMC [Facklamia]|uniref:chromosome segregation protein SMC n=1 Tax=Facklamia TaxID=66831 RepID=UPI0003537E51|nr:MULTISPECIES: chromosome segregation protein SMC [Facklamia]EPH12990.1 chromosome segregation protein SMC [Facklamia hominis ACS-120-V-Sch10]OFL68148.1 chromosome segregation protein SMC [Facklamia sp. HMSC062C11]